MPPNCFSQPQTRPATKEDFDSLPDPSPDVLRELAPQVGVPVDDPVFEPADVPIGSPYTRPDGSTAEPRAKVSPASDGQVAVDVYDKPLTSPDGTPVPDGTPNEDKPEQQPDSVQCDKYPDSLGCLRLGEAPDSVIPVEERSIANITPINVGGVGSCPAPLTASFMGQPISFTWDMPCQAAGMIKPLILSLAWLSAGVIFIGGVRQ